MKNYGYIAISAVIYIAGLALAIAYFRPIYMDWVLQSIAKLRYRDDFSLGMEKTHAILLSIYYCICYFWMRKTMVFKKSESKKLWLLGFVIDVAILPFSVLLVVWWHNIFRLGDNVDISTIENFLLVWILLNAKHIIFRLEQVKS